MHIKEGSCGKPSYLLADQCGLETLTLINTESLKASYTAARRNKYGNMLIDGRFGSSPSKVMRLLQAFIKELAGESERNSTTTQLVYSFARVREIIAETNAPESAELFYSAHESIVTTCSLRTAR